MSQRELGFTIGFQRTHITKIECGRCLPTVQTIYLLAETLHTSALELTLGDEQREFRETLADEFIRELLLVGQGLAVRELAAVAGYAKYLAQREHREAL